jgi:asparagine synthase (glutamine-hydrolysing)
MCGIGGCITKETGVLPLVLARMGDLMAHRGPDASGRYIDGPVGLCHTRLSILDLSEAANQPMATADGRFVIVFNGEIYNFRQIRAELGSGIPWRTHSDTEVLLQAWARWGGACIERLNGMFAFAVYDARDRILTLVRDRFGIKPLYYARLRHTFVFGSEVKALFGCRELPFEMDTDFLPEYLMTRFVSGQDTLFRRVKQLAPGHVMKIATQGFPDTSVTQRRYWDFQGSRLDCSIEESAGRFLRELDRSVESMMVSDVPVGAQMSAGLDSTTVTCLAAGHNHGIASFTVGFQERGYDESADALRFAQEKGIHCQGTLVNAEALARLMTALTWHLDEPINHPNTVGIFILSRFARPQVTVLLSGEGADELLCGYPHYRTFERAMRRRGPHFREALLRAYLRITPIHKGRDRVAKDLKISSLRGLSAGRLSALLTTYLPHEYWSFMGDVQGRAPWLEKRAALYEASPFSDPLSSCQYYDIKTYLPALLVRQDKMSMAASIENRVPFLDNGVAEYVMALPPHHRLHGRTTKRVLRRAAAPLLPRYIRRRPKNGFTFPLVQWLRTPQCTPLLDILRSKRFYERGIFPPPVLNALLADAGNLDAKRAETLWILLALEIWLETFEEFGRTRVRVTLPEAETKPS